MVPLLQHGGRPIVVLDHSSPTPKHEQIRDQVVMAIALGTLGIGAQLPTIKELAEELHIAPKTVGTAYKQLAKEGVVKPRGRSGTVVLPQGREVNGLQLDKIVSAGERFVEQASRGGLTRSEAMAIVRSAWARLPDVARVRP